MIGIFSKLQQRIRARSLEELAPFAIFALIAALLLGFGKIASVISSGSTYSFDEKLLVALRHPADLADPIGPAWLENVMRDDVVQPSLPREQVVANAPDAIEGQFRVDAVLE